MSYPLIILGAGASYDSVPDDRITGVKTLRPPVSDSLFDVGFDDFIRRFPEVKALAVSVISDVKAGISLEDSLLQIKNRVPQNPERGIQLVMFEFYLQELFLKISDFGGGFGGQTASNYQGLIQEIRDGPKKAIVVNFNYDTLFESDLNPSMTSTEDYVRGEIKVIKIHGSCNWVYLLRKDSHHSEYDFVRETPSILAKLRQNTNVFPHHISRGDGTYFRLPALAIPLPGKSDFICPPHHRKILEQELSKIDSILIIGWSANDTYLTNLIRKTTQPIKMEVVSGEKETMDRIFRKFAICPNILCHPGNYKGFSAYMASRERKTFFGTA